jgi:Na+/melibiose symporter-like transporter
MTGHWGAATYVEQLSSTAITFKLRPMVDSPLWITAITSFNLVFNVVIGATVNYASDRLWTRWGRRRPFIMTGQAVMAIGLLFLPGFHSLGPLIAMLFCYELMRDINTPFEPLLNEIIPPQQRGRAAAMGKIWRTVATALFFGVMLAQYDHVHHLPGGITITGEQAIFWVGSLLALYTFALLAFGVRETPPPASAQPRPWPGVGPAIRGYFKDVFGDPQWRALYWVGLAMTVFWLGLGSLGPLLYTEQFGYSKAVYGWLIAVGTPFNLLLFLPLGGWLADKIDRMLIFKAGAMATAIMHLAFYLYARFGAPGGVPPVAFLVTFSVISTGLSTVAALAANPLIFDFIPRDKMGTVSSGIGVVRGIAAVLINNGVGLWVTLWSRWFGPPGKYDYLSGYLYLTLLALGGTAVALWFEHQVRAGRFIKYGKQENDREAASGI